MTIPAHLLSAYQATSYTALLPHGEIVLRIGEPCPALDALLQTLGHTSWAYVTACNPGSRLDEAANAERQAELVAEVERQGRTWFPGRAIADDGSWPAEDSLWIPGLAHSGARALGRAFGQLAVVVGELGGPPRLVSCEAGKNG